MAKAYIPIHAFRKTDIQSILSIALSSYNNNNELDRKFDHHHSRRTMLYYLLAMYYTPNNTELMNLINECNPNMNWSGLEENYHRLEKVIEPYQIQNNAQNLGTYWELKKMTRSGSIKALEHISKYRQQGFKSNELKLYWNYQQIRDLNQIDRYNQETDTDTHETLNKFPVNTRKNSGKIEFIQSGIENAVFEVPEDKQVIVLDFADERMPGGYFLENARTQEEVILYNSDGYRALLDLKYQLMNGGYILPEYGVAYIKNVRFFQESSKQERSTDLIVAACYDMSGMGEGLYKPPSYGNREELRKRTYEKFQATIASAVANTKDDGKDTYLLLGPIGTGAFANNIEMIAEIFSEILNHPLMDSENAIRYAFDKIWFVSIDSLSLFAEKFPQKTV